MVDTLHSVQHQPTSRDEGQVRSTDYEQVPKDVLDAIDKDVARTFPEHEYFSHQPGHSSGQGDLQSVLRAYAALDPEVGYCQGLNFLAGCILLYCQDMQLAFQVLHALLIQQNMRVLYVPDLRELQVGCSPWY